MRLIVPNTTISIFLSDLLRFTRGIKTLKELHSKAKSGRVVDETEIPPLVSVNVASGIIPKPMPAEVPSLEKDLLAPSPIPSEAALPEPLVPTPAVATKNPPIPPPRKVPEPQQEMIRPPLEPPVDYNEPADVSLPPVNGKMV